MRDRNSFFLFPPVFNKIKHGNASSQTYCVMQLFRSVVSPELNSNRQTSVSCARCHNYLKRSRVGSIHNIEQYRSRRGGDGGCFSPPIGLSTKTQNKKNTTFLALLRLFFLRWNGLKSDLKQFLRHIQRGVLNRRKLKSQIDKSFKKCPKINNEI